MYEHYEKHRTDNITDPELRNSRPISTISGWDQERDEMHNNIHPQIQQSQQVQTVQTDDFNEKDDEQPQQLKAIEQSRTINESPQQQQSQEQTTRIASISDVYNKEINGEVSTVVIDEQQQQPQDGETSKLKDILEQQLGNPEEESREIATEIVEEILQKSEKLLDECKQVSDDLLNQHETAVIKDEELEQAVHEVVTGVRQIQLKAAEEEIDELKSKQQHENDTVDDTNKTDAEASAIINDTKQSIAGKRHKSLQ